MKVANGIAGGTGVCMVLAAAGAVVLASGTTASAQPLSARSRVEQRPVMVGQVARQYATHHGFSRGPLGGALADCVVTSSLTDHPFAVGTNAMAQAGFAEGEVAAVTFTIPSNSFPIKLNTAEILWGKLGSNAPTIEWSVQIWQGTPTLGEMIVHESSDGQILPHATIPASANALHMTFQVDPNDPEQIIIQDNGSHSFTVGFKIDQHHNAPDPCNPDPFTNAFPMTDLSGLDFPGGNWVFGNAACSSSCPSGWSTFGALGTTCRPSGDWIIRATWEPVGCEPATGACCLSGLTCQVLTQAGCIAQGGLYQGDNTACTACPSATGACCFSGGSCLNFSEADCTTAGGVYQGNGTTCGPGNSCPTGACCLADGTCMPAVTSAQCSAQGGVYQGAGTDCGSVTCPQPTGACCVGTGCLLLTQADCAVIPGVWAGPNTNCAVGCGPAPCYANCDLSTASPVLNVADFSCFLQRFSTGHTYANCDQSTQEPVLNVADFSCFLQAFAAGCP